MMLHRNHRARKYLEGETCCYGENMKDMIHVKGILWSKGVEDFSEVSVIYYDILALQKIKSE